MIVLGLTTFWHSSNGLGFQFLSLSSAEDPHSETLGLLEFHVQSITTPPTPSVGWYPLTRHISVDMFSIYPDLVNQLLSHEFYFTHSYAATVPFNESANTMRDGCSAQAFYYLNQHQQEVVGAVVQGKFVGLQFHPEKSG